MRAFSIALVLLAHLAGTRSFPLTVAAGTVLGLGELGVHVFFVISGFLITRLLFEELARTGGISLGNFYFRRTMRSFPAYYAFLLVLFLLAFARKVQLWPGDLVHALTYTSNYHAGRSWFVGHTWSLSVEEQFYLLWPALVVLAGRRRALVAAACAVVMAPMIRTASWELMRWSGDGIGHRFETVADAIAIGCVLAGTRDWLHQQPLVRRALESPWFVVVPCLAVAGNLLEDHPVAHFLIGMTVMNVAIAATLDWCVTFGSGWARAQLRAAGVRRDDQLLALLVAAAVPESVGPERDTTFPLNIALACAVALASYYLVEQPSLRIRRWVEVCWHRPNAAPAAGLPGRQLNNEHILTEGTL